MTSSRSVTRIGLGLGLGARLLAAQEAHDQQPLGDQARHAARDLHRLPQPLPRRARPSPARPRGRADLSLTWFAPGIARTPERRPRRPRARALTAEWRCGRGAASQGARLQVAGHGVHDARLALEVKLQAHLRARRFAAKLSCRPGVRRSRDSLQQHAQRRCLATQLGLAGSLLTATCAPCEVLRSGSA